MVVVGAYDAPDERRRAVGLVSVSDLVRANLLGHRLYYLGCLDGDVANLAALRGCFDYHLAAYERELVGNAALETF